jgi:F-type H+-transporting ATPase subunit a
MSLMVLTLGESENPVNHVLNRGFKLGDLFGMHDVWLWSSHVGNLVLSGLITIALLWWASTKIRTGPESMGHSRYVTKNPVAHMIEVICVYLRDETTLPMLGSRTDKFMPFLWSVFFFILINNLMGLLPINDVLHLGDQLAHKHVLVGLAGATATGNPWVTAAMAIIAALVFNAAGIRELGLFGYLKHLTAGTSWVLWPLMIPIEIMGTIIKPVALCIRLFANMTAGHILIAVLFMFAANGIGMLTKGGVTGVGLGGGISLISAVSAVAIYFLELFVAFLQAFVFMFLTAVFVAQLSHGDEHEHHEAHDHEHAAPAH